MRMSVFPIYPIYFFTFLGAPGANLLGGDIGGQLVDLLDLPQRRAEDVLPGRDAHPPQHLHPQHVPLLVLPVAQQQDRSTRVEGQLDVWLQHRVREDLGLSHRSQVGCLTEIVDVSVFLICHVESLQGCRELHGLEVGNFSHRFVGLDR